ncbi:MAG: TIGR03560 family F420-dependent LLM class oxidoreductase [candidate division Zixibacteria bacterium]|nr:TIGR03560 family F420-dependent LLM class oxidoreductase [Gammaproteobacteria bacterium]NIX59304.1 TIGR03560 family F420-dependent LLM class oxidoreductase [candidate division Zixibacteria bacterium]
MIEAALMIEGQNGLTWERWMRIAKIADQMGFAGLYRSDHYTNANPPDKESLEVWVSLTWLASHTNNIEFGPLVSPLSFREPTLLARTAASVDDLSGGRLTLGLGAGWQEREHHNYGWELLEIPQRFQRFEEGLEIITRLLNNDEPSTFKGDFYRIEDAILLPRPERKGGPPILIGGNGPKRTLPLAAKYADEWNGLYQSVQEIANRNALLDELAEKEGRDPASIRRSMMIGCEFGRDDAEVKALVEKRTGGKRTPEELWETFGMAVGTANQVVDQLKSLEEAGVQRVMLQWLALDDTDRLEAMAKSVLPQLK